MNISQESDEINRMRLELDRLVQNQKDEKNNLQLAIKELERTIEAQEIIQHLAQAVQQQAHAKISEVVSSCLSTVFDDPYIFQIRFERKRGRTEASLRFIRRGLDVDPINASGGGMIDVAAFALRIACLVLHRPKLSRVAILDEPFKFVSEQYRGNIRTMLEKLSQDLGIQIILVTHMQELTIGKIIEL